MIRGVSNPDRHPCMVCLETEEGGKGSFVGHHPDKTPDPHPTSQIHASCLRGMIQHGNLGEEQNLRCYVSWCRAVLDRGQAVSMVGPIEEEETASFSHVVEEVFERTSPEIQRISEKAAEALLFISIAIAFFLGMNSIMYYGYNFADSFIANRPVTTILDSGFVLMERSALFMGAAFIALAINTTLVAAMSSVARGESRVV